MAGHQQEGENNLSLNDSNDLRSPSSSSSSSGGLQQRRSTEGGDKDDDDSVVGLEEEAEAPLTLGSRTRRQPPSNNLLQQPIHHQQLYYLRRPQRRIWPRILFITILCFALYLLPSLLSGSSPLILGSISSNTGIFGSLSPKAPCSCLSPNASSGCCRRELLVEHKMGTFLVSSIFHPSHSDLRMSALLGKMQNNDNGLRLSARVDYFSIPSTSLEKKKDGQQNQHQQHHVHHVRDYRQVVTTRNWFDALVSGYLYHKSGEHERIAYRVMYI